jgi:phosphoglucosamine mutase
LAKDRLEQGKVMGGVVGTLMTNLAIEVAIKNLGLGFERAKVGDRYVLELLQAKQWVIGGEGSGHLLCLDQHSTGDGTIAALQVLAAMQQKQQSLNELLDGITIYPQVLINVKTNANYQWQADQKLNAMVSKVEESLIGKGRVLIRPSGTEPVLRIMVEANQQSLAQASAEAIAREVSV